LFEGVIVESISSLITSSTITSFIRVGSRTQHLKKQQICTRMIYYISKHRGSTTVFVDKG